MRKKDVLTTGQVAGICNVAPRTVSKWFDSGQLKGYKIPGSKDRRIPYAELIRFLKLHDMPLPKDSNGRLKILLIDYRPNRNLAQSLQAHGDFDVQCAENIFEAGLLALKFSPNVILIDLMNNQVDARQICTYIQKTDELQGCATIALAGGLNQKEAASLLAYHFDAIITDPSDIPAMIAAIENACLQTS
ncbi:MAG: helix-turn-helix domain-containing protein [Planctomycetaceae bacterium]|nr:helix-turn-helix domain-containing protein [Planctomycetaceae bacterium]